jgi:sortase (surface protein transpeptidase)
MKCLTLYSIYRNNDHVFKAILFKIEIICTFVKIINLKKANQQTNKAKQNKQRKQQQKNNKIQN